MINKEKRYEWRKIVVNIEVRQNGSFAIGYPYNSSVDSYFHGLTTDFISNYDLDLKTINSINKHKNDTLKFDRDIHEFIIKLSAFILGFETSGQRIIDAYDNLKIIKNELEFKYNDIKMKKDNSESEYIFISENINQIKLDIEKLIELIQYYNAQIVDDTISYNTNYIEDSKMRIMILNDLIERNLNESNHYKDSLIQETELLANINQKVNEYSFEDTSLRMMYESWVKRDEEYYKQLVIYFKDEYEKTWNYGVSLMYGETLKDANAENLKYKMIASKWQETLFKEYNFKIEKDLKEYSIVWLEKYKTFDLDNFTRYMEIKKKALLEENIIEVEKIINTKNQAVKQVIGNEKEKNYYKYRELVQEKRKYIFMNINGTIDSQILDDFDNQLNILKADHLFVSTRLSQKTYWQVKADLERYHELLIDLQRQLDKTNLAISRNFKRDNVDNSEALHKIAMYENEKKSFESKIFELQTLKNKLELDINAFKDEMTLIESRIYENKSLSDEKVKQYSIFFNERIPFFTQNITISENEGIVEILDGKFYRMFDKSYESFVEYNSNIEWFNKNDREKLKVLYAKLLSFIEKNMHEQWNKEFNHEILNIEKIKFYKYYFMNNLKTLFATINKHIITEKYSKDIIDVVKIMVEKIKNIFEIYLDIAYTLKENIEVMTNIYDYDDVYVFNISTGEETMSNIKETFYSILEGIVSHTYTKNIEYKNVETQVTDKAKIDQLWLDMEKKYV